MVQRRRPHDAETDSDNAAERKKLRNRMSQQAFRQRQVSYIRDLERRLERSGATDNERVAELEEENQRLRRQLTACRDRLASAQASLKNLCRLMHDTLSESAPTGIAPNSTEKDVPGELNADQEEDIVHHTMRPACTEPQLELMSVLETDQHDHSRRDGEFSPATMSFNQHEAYAEAVGTFDFLENAFQTPERAQDNHTNAERESNLELPTGAEYTLCDDVPGIWSYGYQMGPSAYQHAMERSPRLRGSNIKSSNSIFSDHISSLRDCIWNKWQQIGQKQPADIRLYKLQQSVSVMFSMFNGLTRPLAMSWYTPTKWYNHISDLTTWQLNPTREMYARLHPRYRPSALQITESYPTFIDWNPFPALRDKLILTHAANPLIDEIVLDMANSYVVETDLSLLLSTARRPTPGYVHVWDIIQAMSDDDPPSHSLEPHDSTAALPAPSAAAIFQSPARARLVFRLLRMDDGAAVYKLDPAVFAKHPELYSPELADIVAVGAPLVSSSSLSSLVSPQAPVRVPIPHPVRLDRETLKVYRHFADWALNAICDARW